MKIVKTAINSAIFIVVMAALSGCSGDTVYVEIDNPKHREMYLRLLDEKGFEYKTDELGNIAIKADSIEKLNKEMKEYYEFREAEVLKLNRATE